MNRNSIITLILILLFLCFSSCSDNTTAPNNEDENEGKVDVNITIDTGQVRTFVGESIKYESTISKSSTEIQLQQKWRIEPSNIANIDSLGEATILDLGKANVITSLYDEEDNFIASDTVRLYSEAKKTLETMELIQSFTKNDDGAGILVGSSGSDNLFFSSDYGDSWNLVTTPVPNSSIENMSRAKLDPNYLLATYREPNLCCNDEEYTGILLTNDNGTTWSEITHPYTPTNDELFYEFSTVTFAPDDIETLYALTKVNSNLGGIRLYRSTNLGSTWQILKTFERGTPTSPSLFIDNEHNLYVAAAGQVANAGGYASLDKGASWNTWSRNKTERLYHIDDTGTLYGRNFAGNTTAANQQIVYSESNFQTWEILLEDDAHDLIHLDTFETESIAVLMVTDSNYDHKIKYTNDGGRTWEEYKLSFNDLKTFNRPSKLKITDVTDESMELLCFWGNSSYGDREKGEVWKLNIFFDL